MSRKFLKDKSLYTIKKLHEKSNNGIIYENDYATILKNDGLYDEMPLFSDSIFKYKTKTSDSGTKRHIKTDWYQEDNISAWTKNDISNVSVNVEKKIELNQNYTSLKDFAYYGSAVELIKTTIRNIMLTYPGGLCYYSNEEYAPSIDLDGETYYFISNECQIDCWSKNDDSINDNKNYMRYLSFSYNNYVDSNGENIEKPEIKLNGSNCFNSIIGTVTICGKIFNIYKDRNGQNHLVTKEKNNGLIIKPKSNIIDDYFNSLCGFEKIILGDDVIFDTPYITDSGYYTTPKKYTWPVISGDGFTFIDLSSYRFNTYIESLYELASFHDEYDSDNIWRMMTHESIKNMDLSYNSFGDDLSEFDNTRIKKMIHIQGRQYDEIKSYIDGIKNSISLSYNKKNNTPNYFLTSIIENDGWDSKNVYSHSNKYTSDYINNEFLRRLALNSNYIQSMKGTKKGIETIFGLFGFNVYGETPDIEITEYYAKVKNSISYSEASCLRGEFDYVNADELTNYMEGYPVALVESGEDIVLYPWYDHNEKYIGDFYYQSKGGWGKTNTLNIENNNLVNVSEISGNCIYSETEPYMLYLNNLKELTSLTNNKLREGMICYVSNINGIENLYNDINENVSLSIDDFSNYFKLGKIALSTELGYVKNSKFDNCYGWLNIKNEDFNKEILSDDVKKILYLETLKEKTTGNNPHTGKGEYDFGLDYLLKYKNLFREFSNCDIVGQENFEKINNFGFEFDGIISSDTKCKILTKHENELNEEYDESFKIINIKNTTIRFPNAYGETKKYIIENVLPYVEMMIPSTSIVEYLFGDEKSYIETMQNKLTSKTNTYNIEPADVIIPETESWFEEDMWRK